MYDLHGHLIEDEKPIELDCWAQPLPKEIEEIEMRDRSQAVVDRACENLRRVAEIFTLEEIEQAESFLAAELAEGFTLVNDVRAIAHQMRMPCDLLSLVRWSMGVYENEPTYARPRTYAVIAYPENENPLK